MGRNPLDEGYKMVAPRHAQFVIDHPDGRVVTQVEHFIFDPTVERGFVTVRAEVFKHRDNPTPDGIGNASMPIPGVTNFTRNSEVENAETSALGRALAMIGYHPKDTLASGEEIASKASPLKLGPDKELQAKVFADRQQTVETTGTDVPATQREKNHIFALAKERGVTTPQLSVIRQNLTGKRSTKAEDGFTSADARTVLDALENTVTIAAALTGGKVE
jgi:hypothetical protein